MVLKEAICKDSVLHSLDFSDASHSGVVGVLMKVNKNGDEVQAQ